VVRSIQSWLAEGVQDEISIFENLTGISFHVGRPVRSFRSLLSPSESEEGFRVRSVASQAQSQSEKLGLVLAQQCHSDELSVELGSSWDFLDKQLAAPRKVIHLQYGVWGKVERVARP
jgi:hypothetical protein